ncbi:hypothetical protein ACH4TE_00345 [Streptomyces sioyaensis]|uniref:hypothetical protein n=1 Tax=Streptomyces sioyaensis TaxID=67364 RepID=UPI00378CB78C
MSSYVTTRVPCRLHALRGVTGPPPSGSIGELRGPRPATVGVMEVRLRPAGALT